MAGVLDTVDSRTRLVGENRLEILLFQLSGPQLFALNVFKIREVLTLPALTQMPQRHPHVVGVIHLRGQTIPVIDLAGAIGLQPIPAKSDSTIIVTEYNLSVQAFLVGSVDRIMNLNWDTVQPPPKGAGRAHYLTAITRLENMRLVEIIDVEKVLAEIVPFNTRVSEELLEDPLLTKAHGREVLLVDDSPTGINQLRATLAQLHLNMHVATDGLKALRMLQAWADAGDDMTERLLMVITDAEMPEMDGYRLTAEIRKDPRLKDLHVVLHTSLSGNFNKAMVEKVGCDGFLSKFQPDQLVETVRARLQMLEP
ncbi:chemotaxis protein CheV [Pseudomonas neustonica]|uniref:Chemotaxis signal transduction protein CheV n=1 Tax=Pseudomonas neustonica TaxID=2487346 RepID=A0ABX9XH41_9PSED|nr:MULTISPECIES: chemotaxis protein CheV [Pseudomonas]MAB23455.1 chemotaxis protein CheW [Pseudomonadales bacterium]MBA6418776.1 chemotaxis protein CheV [Pseudomonas sp. 5Ae-yellow]ROZ81945.1 chemotaxis signal transduction protein CheV [Pseudomonas sp. SSM44]ROZ83781.1 chemotaxis signal transduction protein CheV [Pseudomonas neustonica]|tara:strand:+ start:605 stop:1537 length:933 start_codon:yes stop_codon:yes gene_type:complete